MEPAIDPNRDFDAALRAAAERSAGAQPEPGERGGPPPPPPDPTTLRPLADQILEETRQAPPPGEEPLRERSPLDRFDGSPQLREQPQPPAAAPPEPEPPTLPPAAAAPPEPPAETPEERADRLERELAEAQAFAGRQTGDVGDLRRQLELMQARIDGRVDVPQPVVYQPLTDDQIERGLQMGAERFIGELYEADHPSYDAALDAWAEESPGAAMRFAADIAAYEAEERVRRELGQTLGPLVQRTVESETQGAWNESWRQFLAANPQAVPYADKMLDDLEKNPWLALPIKEKIPDAHMHVLGNLLQRAGAGTTAAVERVQQEQLEQERRDKTDATVATSTSSAPPGAGTQDLEVAAETRLKSSILDYDKGMSIHEAIASARS